MLYLRIALTRIYLIQCHVNGRCPLLAMQVGLLPSVWRWEVPLVRAIVGRDVSPTENVSSLAVMGVCALTSCQTLVRLKVSSSAEKVDN